ncbi:MAG: helix-turn-helix domain-containing protein [Lachnospiraceae bacterium]
MDENLKHYTIGEVVRLTGVSSHTLRYYDKMGIFKPSYIDMETGYRYYDSNQFWKLEIIKLCKYMEFSLEDMKEILQKNKDESFMEVLLRQRSNIKRIVEKYTEIIDDIDWYLDENRKMNTAKVENPQIQVKHLKEKKVIYKRNVRSYKEFHLTLQSISLKETNGRNTMKRHYGHFFDLQEFQKGFFYREGEFLDLDLDQYKNTDPENIYTFPAGTYVTLITNVRGEKRGIKALNSFLKEKKLIPRLVFGIEVGWPLFDALNDLYCEVHILVEEREGENHEIQGGSGSN